MKRKKLQRSTLKVDNKGWVPSRAENPSTKAISRTPMLQL